MLSPYFKHFSYGREQDLVEDLIVESIKIYGHEVRYLPREAVNKDDLWSEDPLNRFNVAAGVEVYIKNVEGFEGEGEFLSKFGLELRDQITFTIARKRFNQIRTEKLSTENGYNYLLESADTKSPSRQFLTSGSGETDSILLEDGDGDNYDVTQERPYEGDLIYFPLVEKLFEVKFVEHEEIFYQTGRLQTYDLSCELFEYSSERLDTGNTEIDAIEDTYSHDVLVYEYTLEDESGVLLLEDGGSILQEYRIEDTDTGANNELYTSEVADFVDFSEDNPFSQIDRY